MLIWVSGDIVKGNFNFAARFLRIRKEGSEKIREDMYVKKCVLP